jgi:predicted nucleotidyltransferase
MSADEHSFRKLLPGFVIPAGTQVVLKAAKVLPGGVRFKPSGSVGIVLECPPDNQHPYLVRFTDGETVTAYFDELALRRREVEDELGEIQEDMRPWIIYRCQVGSKAFGLASEDSDDDLRGIYLPPARLHWSLRRLPEQLEFKERERDEVYWELEKFLRLALKANPNVLETLWTHLVLILEQIFSPIVVLGREFLDELRPLAERCITRHHYHHYRGFFATQRKLIAKEEPKRAKPVLYAYRVLMTGIHLLRTGEVEANLLRLNEHFGFKFLDELVARKVGGENIGVGDLDWSFHEARLTELEAALDQAFQESKLPEDRDRKPVNDLLVRLRLGQQ